MDLATQTHLTSLREALRFRRHELATELHAAEIARQAAESAAKGEVADRKDEAVRLQAEVVGDAEVQREVEEARLVDAALKRLDEGRYGDCLDCGEPIPLARLLAQPAAALCTGCQAAHEQRSTGAAAPRG